MFRVMGLRRHNAGYSIQNVMRGRTLRSILEGGTTIKINCESCARSSVWSPVQARNEMKFEPFLDKPIEALADKMSCAGCRSKSFFLTIVVPRNPLLPDS